MTSYLIVGSGAAGIGAVEAIRRRDPSSQIALISNEPEGYYSRPGLAYYLTGELPERQLFPFTSADFERLSVQRLAGEVRRIEAGLHRAVLEDGTVLPYDRLLLATGAEAARAQVPGIQAEGVVKLDNLADARRILQRARKARAAVVVGGGITALEIVEGLVARKVKTHYFLRGDRYWSNVLDEPESRLVERHLVEDGVQIHFHTELEEVLVRKGQVAGVRVKGGAEIPCELVAVAIGVLPRVELARASGLRVERGILVDEFLRTSVPGIFAAGDVAQVYDPVLGKAVLDSLWSPAREQGAVAGVNMVASTCGGTLAPYSKTVAFNVTRLAGLTTTIIGAVGSGRDEDTVGIVRGDSETWRELPDAIAAQSHFKVNRLRLLVGEQVLAGAILIGDQTLSIPLQRLVAEKADIRSIRARLLQPGAPLADLVAEFWAGYHRRSAHAS